MGPPLLRSAALHWLAAKGAAMADDTELERALDKGALGELPPNVPPGFLGEVAPDMRKPEEFRPTLNAGVVQESTGATRALTIALLYLLFVTSPVALLMLWRERAWGRRTKVLWTVVMVAGLLALALYVKPAP